MKLFTLRLFCCYFCYRFFFFFFFFSLGQLDNSICALSHVQWNVAPTSQTDLSGLYTIRVYFFFFSFFLSFSLSRTTFSLIRWGCTPYCACNYWRYHSSSVSWFFRIVHFSFRLFVPEGPMGSKRITSVSQSVSAMSCACVCVQWRSLFVWFDYILGQGKGISSSSTRIERQWRTASKERREIRPWRFLPDGGTWNSAAGWTSIGYTLANALNQKSIWCTPWAAAAVE